MTLEGVLDFSILSLGATEDGFSALVSDWLGGTRRWAIPNGFSELITSQEPRVVITVFQAYGIELDETSVSRLKSNLKNEESSLVRFHLPEEQSVTYWEGPLPSAIRRSVSTAFPAVDSAAQDQIARGIHGLIYAAEDGLSASPVARLPIFFFGRVKDLLNKSLEVISEVGRKLVKAGKEIGELLAEYADKKISVWNSMSGKQKALLVASTLTIAVAAAYLGPGVATALHSLVAQVPAAISVAYFLKDGEDQDKTNSQIPSVTATSSNPEDPFTSQTS